MLKQHDFHVIQFFQKGAGGGEYMDLYIEKAQAQVQVQALAQVQKPSQVQEQVQEQVQA